MSEKLEIELRDNLDEQILKLITSGESQCYRLNMVLGKFGFRVIDRRLQALRKQGKIIYSRKDGWQIVEQSLSR